MDMIKKYINNKKIKFSLILVVIIIMGFMTAICINYENTKKTKIKQLQVEKQAIMDDAEARAKQAEIEAKAKKQELLRMTINKIKDYGEIVVMKYEFSHETSYEKSGAFVFLSKTSPSFVSYYE